MPHPNETKNNQPNVDLTNTELGNDPHSHNEGDNRSAFLTDDISRDNLTQSPLIDEQTIDTTFDPKDINLGLKKNVISNKDAKTYLNRSFSELIDTGIDLRIQDFFQIYENLFYKIEKFKQPNRESHHDLVDQSLDIRNNFIDLCKPEGYQGLIKCESEEEKLLNHLEHIQSESYSKTIGVEEQNMLYPNGSILRSEAQNEEGMPVWVMVKAEKRAIWSPDTYQTVKKSLGHFIDTPDSNIQSILTEEELNSIPNGPDIYNDVDLIALSSEGDFDPEFTISDVFTWRESIFTCLCGPAVDPDGAIPLYNVFSGGQPNNGDNGKCFIVYYDMESNKQTIELSPGESTIITNPAEGGRIRHRIELIGGESAIPSAFSDPFTPIYDNDGNVHMMDDYGGMNNGVYISGFIREVRFSENGTPLTSTSGVEFLTGGDLDSDGYTDTIHTLEPFLPPANTNYVTSFPTYTQVSAGVSVPFAIYYYNVPRGISRIVKNSIYPSTGPYLDGGQTGDTNSPYVRMITNGEKGKFEVFPPEEDPNNQFKKTMGYNGSFNIADPASDYSYDAIKARDPELIEQVLDNPESLYYDNDFRIRLCLVNLGWGNSGDNPGVYITGNSHQLGVINDYINNGYVGNYDNYTATSGVNNMSYPSYGSTAHENPVLTRVGYNSGNNPGWENSFTHNEHVFWGQSSPYRSAYYVNLNEIGNSPFTFDIDGYDHFGNRKFTSSNPDGPGGLSIWPYMVHGAPIFEAYGVYFTIGRYERIWYGLHNPGSGNTPGQAGRWFRTFMPIGYENWTHPLNKKLVNYQVMFRSMADEDVYDGSNPGYGDPYGGHYLWTRVKDAFTRVANGNATPGNYGLGRCVFPGFSHDYYQEFINTQGTYAPGTTPYNSTGLENLVYGID